MSDSDSPAAVQGFNGTNGINGETGATGEAAFLRLSMLHPRPPLKGPQALWMDKYMHAAES